MCNLALPAPSALDLSLKDCSALFPQYKLCSPRHSGTMIPILGRTTYTQQDTLLPGTASEATPGLTVRELQSPKPEFFASVQSFCASLHNLLSLRSRQILCQSLLLPSSHGNRAAMCSKQHCWALFLDSSVCWGWFPQWFSYPMLVNHPPNRDDVSQ